MRPAPHIPLRAVATLALATAVAATLLPGATLPVTASAAPPALPTTAGAPTAPAAVITRDYDLGRAQLSVLGTDGRPHRLPTRLVGEISIAAGATGRLPVVVILHGAHQSCADGPDGTISSNFPCLPGWEPVASYTGYRYLAGRLAREGFVVVSVDGRPVAPFDHTERPFPDGAEADEATWMDLRARIVDAHLRALVRAGSGAVGPDVDFGVGLAGRVDGGNVGLVGHSRGGEGVVWTALLAGAHPYRVRSIVAIAPTDFSDRIVPGRIPFAVLLPTCDGDVSDLQGAHFYDEARGAPRAAPLLQVAIHGANHDFFNTVWPDEWGPPIGAAAEPDPSAADPGPSTAGTSPLDATGYCDPGATGTARLTRSRQEAVGAEIVSDFLGGTIRGAPGALAALGIGAAPPHRIAGTPVTTRAQEPTADRLDVAPMDSSPYELAQTARGGRITAVRLDYMALCRPGAVGSAPFPAAGGADASDAACPPTWFQQAQVADELRVSWSSAGARLVLPPAPRPTDVRAFAAVTLSVAVTPPDADPAVNSAGGARPFSVVLTDAAGHRSSVAISSAEPAVRAYPTVTVLGTVRVPLARFHGVDLSRIASVELAFDRTTRGAILVTDVAFVR